MPTDERKQIHSGLRVRITHLDSIHASEWMILQEYIISRTEGITGTVGHWVPGHAQDVWFVRHDGSKKISVYDVTEMEIESVETVPALTSADIAQAVKIWLIECSEDSPEAESIIDRLFPHVSVEVLRTAFAEEIRAYVLTADNL